MSFTEARDLLLWYNKWRRDNHVPNAYIMPDPTEIGVAIDKAVECLNVVVDMLNCDSYNDIAHLFTSLRENKKGCI